VIPANVVVKAEESYAGPMSVLRNLCMLVLALNSVLLGLAYGLSAQFFASLALAAACYMINREWTNARRRWLPASVVAFAAYTAAIVWR
jgi:hypothetical protein